MRNCTRWLVGLGLLVAVVLPATSASAQTSGWQPGPDAAGDNTFDGFVDVPANGGTVPGSGSFSVAGWFVDTTAQGWAGADDVQVFLGQMGGGGTMLAKALFAQDRPDVAAATGNPFFTPSGFNAVINGAQVPAGSQTLNVYVHTPGKGWYFKPVNVTGGGAAATAAPSPSSPAPSQASAGSPPVLEISNPARESNACTKSTFNITGTVSDPGVGVSGIDSVEVFINGERNTQYATDLGAATINSDGSWTLTFNPTKFPSMHSNLFVYAHSKSTGKETLVARGFNITDHC